MTKSHVILAKLELFYLISSQNTQKIHYGFIWLKQIPWQLLFYYKILMVTGLGDTVSVIVIS